MINGAASDCYALAMPALRRPRTALLLAAIAVAVTRLCARARVPDDYDSIGFVRALGDFDLQRLQPHFPGYPVFIALGHGAAALGLSSLTALATVSAIAAAATALALFRLARVAAGRDAAGWAALALYAGAWLPWLAGGAALSDGTATAFVALAFAALTFARAQVAALAAGACIALALGTRLSYWPLALSFAVVAARAPRRRAVAVGAVAGTLAWLVPFVAVVGARPLVTLGRTHLVGHFSAWGGSIATRPNLVERTWACARGLVYDGLFAHTLALAAAALLLVFALVTSRDRPRLPWRLVLVVAAPYALWVLFAQNVIDQPRHLLPLVAGACVLIAVLLSAQPRVAFALAALALAASLPLAIARARTLPAAAQAAEWTLANYPARNQVVVFGARAIRFFDLLAPSLLTRQRTWLSEVDVDLERLDVLPPTLYITSEVTLDKTRALRVSDGPTFCRDPRLDRAQPCLTLRRYRIR